MNTGIYEIRNTLNGKRYVGNAVNFGNRCRVHVPWVNTVVDGHAYGWVK